MSLLPQWGAECLDQKLSVDDTDKKKEPSNRKFKLTVMLLSLEVCEKSFFLHNCIFLFVKEILFFCFDMI